MKNTVVIKGNKSGMTVILDPEAAYETLLRTIARQVWRELQILGICTDDADFGGASLTPEQEFEIVNVITEHSQIEILCLVDQDINRIRRCERALKNRLMELSSNTGQFFRGNLKAGELLETETSLVVIGDVEKGARIISKGNVVILGDLHGSVTAGASGNEKTVIVALDMAPQQLKISEVQAVYPEKGKRLGKGPSIAYVENQGICVKNTKKNIFDLFKYN